MPESDNISVHRIEIYYRGTCPVCGWISMDYKENQLENLKGIISRHVDRCEQASKIGLIYNSQLIEIDGLNEVLSEWTRVLDQALLVYHRPNYPDGLDELLFVNEQGHVIEKYMVKSGYRWEVDGTPWLSKVV